MILIDTSIVVDLWRNPTRHMLDIVRDNDAAICGVTIAEIYAGARQVSDFARCDALLQGFRRIAIPGSIWPALGQNLFLLRSNGITVPFTDALIGTVAIEQDVDLWTLDAHFLIIQPVLPRLRLFKAPA
jgi:predicted nucleic acid-binding protein